MRNLLKIKKVKEPGKVAVATLRTAATIVRVGAAFVPSAAARIALAAIALSLERIADATGVETDGGVKITWAEIEAIAAEIRALVEDEINGGSDDGA